MKDNFELIRDLLQVAKFVALPPLKIKKPKTNQEVRRTSSRKSKRSNYEEEEEDDDEEEDCLSRKKAKPRGKTVVFKPTEEEEVEYVPTRKSRAPATPATTTAAAP